MECVAMVVGNFHFPFGNDLKYTQLTNNRYAGRKMLFVGLYSQSCIVYLFCNTNTYYKRTDEIISLSLVASMFMSIF